MNETILKIALAGLLHDVGKFAERGTLDVTADALNEYRKLYQPYFEAQKRSTQGHAAYTAALIDNLDGILPKALSKAGWAVEDTFISLAAGHHKPETPMQWIIAVADRLANGYDNQEADRCNAEIDDPNYKRARLMPMFEHIRTADEPAGDSSSGRWRYPLKPLSPETIFPSPDDAAASQAAEQEYRDLLLSFMKAVGRPAHTNENIFLWFEHFDSLLCDFTAQIPAGAVGNARMDISLYEHLRSTAALATALYWFHTEKAPLSVEAIRDDWQTEKFLLVTADFYGIQDFIFSEGGESTKGRAKTLRGRSFMISLLSELAAHELCNALELPHTSVLLNAAGKFTIVCHNTPSARMAVETASETINSWLVDRFLGENTFGVSMVEAAPTDFAGGRFAGVWRKLAEQVDRKKYNRLDLNKHGGPILGYLNSFNNTLTHPLCPFCGKRASVANAKAKDEATENSCAICRDQVFIGRNIVKKDKIKSEEGLDRLRLAVTTKDACLTNCLDEPIFGRYRVGFTTGLMKEEAQSKSLLRYWRIDRREVNGGNGAIISRKEIGGYVPVYMEGDENDDRFFDGKKPDDDREKNIDQLIPGAPKTFNHIAAMAKLKNEDIESKAKYRGIEALGVLKADVDNLGLIFAAGTDPKLMSLSRLATMSRQFNAFFTLYVPYCLETIPGFSNIYTVFAGGDDLFLVGPWNAVSDFAVFMRRRFQDYVCGNQDITISAGFSLHKPGDPLGMIAKSAEEALEASKDNGRNRLTMFGETATWEEAEKLEAIRLKIESWVRNGLSTGMLYKFGMFQEMEGRKKALKATGITLADVASAMWEPMFKYTLARNIKSDEERNEISEAAKWIRDYGTKLKIPLWRVLYENRR